MAKLNILSNPMKASPAQSRMFLLVIFINFITVCMETDIFAPSFPDMLIVFNTDEETLQQLISWNFIAMALTGLFLGPLSDSFGRRRLCVLSLIVFASGSVGCALTSSLDWLIAFRVVQGLGGGGLFGVLAPAVFDWYKESDAAKVLGWLSSVVTTCMALAPIIGSWINVFFGWHAVFVFIAILAVVGCVLGIFFLPETHAEEDRNPWSLKELLLSYLALHTSKRYLAYIYGCITSTAILTTYIAFLGLLYINHLGIPEGVFGFYPAVVMLAFAVASYFVGHTKRWLGDFRALRFSCALNFIGVAGLLFVGLCLPESVILITLFGAIFSAGTGLMAPMYFARGVIEFPNRKGAATAYRFSARFIINGILLWMVGRYFDGTLLTMALIYFGFFVASQLPVLWVQRSESHS